MIEAPTEIIQTRHVVKLEIGKRLAAFGTAYHRSYQQKLGIVGPEGYADEIVVQCNPYGPDCPAWYGMFCLIKRLQCWSPQTVTSSITSACGCLEFSG